MSAADLAARPRSVRAREALWRAPSWLTAGALAALGAVGYLLIDPQSPDLAAASYRSHLFSLEGLTLWDNSWYGGHHLLAYSLLAPALGAAIGPSLLAALSIVAATALFALVLERGAFPPRARAAAAVWFAFGASVALLSSRVPFDLGLAVALGAVALAQRGRRVPACALAVVASLASPVAGAFLAMAMLAWALASAAGRERRLAATMCVLALAPIVALSVVFPEGGSQPFVPSAFWPALAAVIAILVLIPPRRRALRIGALLYALVLIGSFVVPSAVGGNADRLGALAAGPILAVALIGEPEPRRRWALIALIVPLVYWQANAPVTDFVSTLGNRATQASYYAPLLAELKRVGVGYGRRPARVEVVPTVDHWEARYVAPAVMLARGWERQLDRYRNGLFYGPPGVTPRTYAAWLARNGISWVALPDAALDYSGKDEERVLRSAAVTGPGGYLHEVWQGAHWRLYATTVPLALALEGARMTAVSRQSFTVWVPSPGRYTALVRFTPYWRVARGSGCVREAPSGWTQVRADRPGFVHVAIDFSLSRVFSRGERCS